MLLTCAADGNHSAKDLRCIKYHKITKNRCAQINEPTYEMVQYFNEFSPLTLCDVRGAEKMHPRDFDEYIDTENQGLEEV